MEIHRIYIFRTDTSQMKTKNPGEVGSEFADIFYRCLMNCGQQSLQQQQYKKKMIFSVSSFILLHPGKVKVA